MVLWICFILLLMEDKVLYCKAGYSFICFGVSVSTVQLSLTYVCLLVSQTQSEYNWLLLYYNIWYRTKTGWLKSFKPNWTAITLQVLIWCFTRYTKWLCCNSCFCTGFNGLRYFLIQMGWCQHVKPSIRCVWWFSGQGWLFVGCKSNL